MDNLREKILKFLHLDNLFENASGYVEARLELFKLEIREDVAKILAIAMVYIAIGLFGFLLLMFFSIGLAHFLNNFFSYSYIGYWIVAGIYGVGFLVFLIFRDHLYQNFERHFLGRIKKKNK